MNCHVEYEFLPPLGQAQNLVSAVSILSLGR
jgi:hypothetical protein